MPEWGEFTVAEATPRDSAALLGLPTKPPAGGGRPRASSPLDPLEPPDEGDLPGFGGAQLAVLDSFEETAEGVGGLRQGRPAGWAGWRVSMVRPAGTRRVEPGPSPPRVTG